MTTASPPQSRPSDWTPAQQDTTVLPGQRGRRELWTVTGRPADSNSPLPGSALCFLQLCWPPLPNRPGTNHLVALGGWREGFPPDSWGSGLPQASPEGCSFPLPTQGGAVSFGSFCGLGLLFLSTVVRKPLPQKVSAGGLVYRGDTRRAPSESHPHPQARSGAIRLASL